MSGMGFFPSELPYKEFLKSKHSLLQERLFRSIRNPPEAKVRVPSRELGELLQSYLTRAEPEYETEVVTRDYGRNREGRKNILAYILRNTASHSVRARFRK